MTSRKTLTLAGTDVARIGLGTNRLTDTPENVAFLQQAVAAGLGHIDTAHLYTSGASETTIGGALPGGREGCIVATKGGYRAGEGRPEVLRAQVDESLRLLQRDSIDLYYLHRVDPETPLEESLAALAACRDEGTIHHVGLSEVSVEQIERAREIVPVAAIQNHYNLSERGSEEVVDYCTREGIAFVPFCPRRGDGGRRLAEVAEARGVTPHQVTLAWLLQRSPVMLPIPGTLSLDHLEANLAALDLELSEAELDALR
jgi:aryl-alcohol dehydrogenase-like predicted oxidoreductase